MQILKNEHVKVTTALFKPSENNFWPRQLQDSVPSSFGGEGVWENIWYIREWMIIHNHEASPCFNKTNGLGVSRWQPMITHDPETEWVKITENWWKSGARGQMALKRGICDYYFLGFQFDRAWIYFLWEIYRAVATVCQRENGCICFLPMAND